MVTDNVGTDLDITNGTRVGIVLGHPDEDASELCLSSWRRKDSNAGSTTTPSYAFTDYRSQGQPIKFAVADLVTPATGPISLFNIYVALVTSDSCPIEMQSDSFGISRKRHKSMLVNI